MASDTTYGDWMRRIPGGFRNIGMPLTIAGFVVVLVAVFVMTVNPFAGLGVAVAGIGVNRIAPEAAPVASPGVQAAMDAAASVRRQLEHDDKLARDGVPALDPISLAEALPEGRALPERDTVAAAVRDAVLARVSRWERAIKAGLGAAGPLGPVLTSYTDNIPMLGKPVSVLSPNGTELAVGYFVGIDAWGRAIVKLGTGEEKTYSAEMVSLREV